MNEQGRRPMRLWKRGVGAWAQLTSLRYSPRAGSPPAVVQPITSYALANYCRNATQPRDQAQGSQAGPSAVQIGADNATYQVASRAQVALQRVAVYESTCLLNAGRSGVD